MSNPSPDSSRPSPHAPVLTWLLIVAHAALLIVLVGNVVYLRRRRSRETPSAWPTVSVLVPARNEADNLRRLLPSLLDQAYSEVEIIVYDDGSDDDTAAVLEQHAAPRLRVLRGEGPPPGWVGKVHALHEATRAATGDVYLFLDADAELRDSQALRRLVEHHHAQAEDAVLTGLPRLRGGAKLLVSLVPNATLVGLPWPLVVRTADPSLAALNGQCWMIRAALYHEHEPHAAHPNEVLEDVTIGRYLKARGLPPVQIDVQDEINIFMYKNATDAWHGFRKNAYLLMGGTTLRFVIFFALFFFCFVIPPFVSGWFLLSIYALKAVTDRVSGFPAWVSLFAPLSYALGWALQADSAFTHWTGRARWKGRPVALREEQET